MASSWFHGEGNWEKMNRSLILGGAGFLGSHLCDRLLTMGHQVVIIDDLSSGKISNIEYGLSNGQVAFVEHDICRPIELSEKFDFVFNLASPASPPRYSKLQRKTLRTGSIGTLNAIELASMNNARFIQASTSEVYGDPEVHPQLETYWGNVNPIGPRSCYDESKRFSEALCIAHMNETNLNVGLARIFNTYGPRLDPIDGRVVSNLICQALNNQPMTIFGDGTQTRSFCYVSDLISGLIKLAYSNQSGPYNLGNPQEISVNDLCLKIRALTNSSSTVQHLGLPIDDPVRRCPDISKAISDLSWRPEVKLEEGLKETIDFFASI
jgi:nucleoside-diphosphate-sugar epimerase